MSRSGFALPTLPPPPSGSTPARWTKLVGSASLVAASVGALYFSAASDAVPFRTDVPERRRAEPSSAVSRAWPLVWLSRSHAFIELPVRVESTVTRESARVIQARVALDTGSSVPVLTNAGLRRFGLDPVSESPRSVASFTGAAVRAFPLSGTVLLDPDWAEGGVGTPASLHIEGDLYSVDVIASPLDLAPRGGAVRLDLAQRQLVRCESLKRCLPGRGWSVLDTVACPDTAGLFGVRTMFGGAERILMVDTGGHTSLERDAGSSSEFVRSAELLERSALEGASHKVGAVRATGSWKISLGRPEVALELEKIWLPDTPRGGALARCFPDGSLGLDAFVGCTLVIEDTLVPRAFVRCDAKK